MKQLIRKKKAINFCPMYRSYQSLFLIASVTRKQVYDMFIGNNRIIIIDVHPYLMENKYESYLVNKVIAKVFHLNIFMKEEMLLFWFDDLVTMEIRLDCYLDNVGGDDKLIMVLIG